MKITAPCAALAPALGFVRGLISAKPPVPILGAVRAEAVDGELQLYATDLDCALYASVPCEIEAAGAAIIDKRLAALADNMPRDAEIAISAVNGTVTLSS